MAQTLSDNVTVLKTVRAHKLASAMGVITQHVGVTFTIYDTVKINAYAAVISMSPARDTTQVRLDDIWSRYQDVQQVYMVL